MSEALKAVRTRSAHTEDMAAINEQVERMELEACGVEIISLTTEPQVWVDPVSGDDIHVWTTKSVFMATEEQSRMLGVA